MNPRTLAMGAVFFGRLPFVLRKPLTLEESQRILQQRLADREQMFLSKLRRTVFEHDSSPYRPLLRRAGCEYGDVENGVRRDGIEETLRALFRNGVYLTVDEFKGRRPAARGDLRVEVNPDRLRNPCAASHMPLASGGSRTGGTPVLMDLAFIRGCAVDCQLYLHARGGARWRKATWEVPGAGARFRLIKFACFGEPPARWFSQVAPDAPDLDPVFRWNTRALCWSSRLGGVPLPGPVHAPLADARPVAAWLQEELRAARTPHLITFTSSAVAACRAAAEHGFDIAGAQFTLGGEPITAARLASVSKMGVQALPRYGSIECGPVGYGCLKPSESDDVHLLTDLHALIQAGADGEAHGLPREALLITALHPKSPFVMFNVSMGDHAVIERRRCGCPLEALGWQTHLRAIGSYEKLTGGGMTFSGTDVIRVLEQVLPLRFGGLPTDYQLVEEEDAAGQPRVRLLVSPRVGPDVNPTVVAEVFLTALGDGPVTNRLMERMWRESKLFTVERQTPYSTRSGKVLHFHLLRQGHPAD
ncbi:MAG: hypothetical protein FJ395_07975 [Verrucomicrobia bacterium]|nr:hypothetical protein [Verrucomicrobiota bacterium]